MSLENPEQSSEETESRLEIKQYTDWAEDRLNRVYGVNNLSTSEGVHLRSIIERILPKIKEEKDLIEKGEMSIINGTEVEEEAAEMWLYELYGLKERDLVNFVVEDETTGEKHFFSPEDENLAKHKKEELLKDGHEVYLARTVVQENKDKIDFSRKNSEIQKNK